ncbi:conserved hypothetical protein [Paraburkholderia ribeironis]|uniref:Uncharacterized protein n=2 Tax=Paraburkholderia ribeironis TaxID=1247936 RepID=A0A1N7RIE8_9BURK|nr:conserved hypothetical protein [Paraburkholderia ribeironis]
MLRVLFKDAAKAPGKLLALCFIVYFASQSFIIDVFLFLFAVAWVASAMKKKSKAILAAEAEAEAARAEAEKLAAAARVAAQAKAQAAAMTGMPASNDSNAKPASTKQYAKSAVVIPFKTGT